jgi:cellulose synthase/poly-beta-1,6-N-acetylglucosamine synthase-like glycosyltransferase
LITWGWFRLPDFEQDISVELPSVSVIIAFRNEAPNIRQLLDSILAQDYPAHLLEIFLVNDHSDDDSVTLINSYINDKQIHSINLVSLAGKSAAGKKSAILEGIRQSRGELIVLTDADCRASAGWISQMAGYYSLFKPALLLGPVRFTGNSWFDKLQSLEFISLMATAAGSCRAGFPVLANGANIAFTKEAFKLSGGFEGNLQFASGDDMFLLQRIKAVFGSKAVHFIRSKKAIVSTAAQPNLSSFVRQRLRWVSKSRGYNDIWLIITSLLVFFANTILTAFIILSWFYHDLLLAAVSFFVLKTCVDLPLLISYSRFGGQKQLLGLVPLLEVLNAFYTTIIAIAGNLLPFSWKGRKLR